MKTEERRIIQALQFKSFKNRASNIPEKEKKEKRRNHLGNSILNLIVIFQVHIFVFPIFCKLLADQKYP